jgi:tripartite-type tricarboxylate transporter receptor subunit TctC
MKLLRRRFLYLSAGAAACPAVLRLARADAFPSRPVHIIVGFPAAGGPDIVARLIAAPLSDRLGQQFIVEDRPGAASSIAAQDVVNAPADGYTLLMATGANTINTSLYQNLKFDFARDLAPVAIINNAPFVMAINPSLPAKTILEFITYAKANPGRINMASPGIGSTAHLCYELLKMMTGIELVHVPYSASFISDLIAGQVQCALSTVPQAIEYVRDGKLRAFAVTSAMRVNILPDVPTVGEVVPSYEADSWFGIVAPKSTSTEIINKLHDEIGTMVADPKLKVQLVGLGVLPVSMTTAQFGKLIVDYTEVGQGNQIRGHQARIGSTQLPSN